MGIDDTNTFRAVESSFGGSRKGASVLVSGLLSLIAVWAPPRLAEAQSGGKPDVSKKAQKKIQRGRSLYEQGKYERSANVLRDAYRLAPVPMLLYNLSLAEWKAGDLEKAKAAARRAAKRDLPGDTNPKNRARLLAFDRVLAARRAAGRTPEKPDRHAAPKRNGTSSKGGGFGGLGWTGVGLVLGGGPGFGLGAWYDYQTGRAVDRMKQARSRGDIRRANRILREEVRPRQREGRLFVGIGAVLAATGATFVLVDLLNGASGAQSERASGTSTPDRLVRPRFDVGPRRMYLELEIRLP